MKEQSEYKRLGAIALQNHYLFEVQGIYLENPENAKLRFIYTNLQTKDKEIRTFRKGQEIDSVAVLGDESGDRSNLEVYAERSTLRETAKVYHNDYLLLSAALPRKYLPIAGTVFIKEHMNTVRKIKDRVEREFKRIGY